MALRTITLKKITKFVQKMHKKQFAVIYSCSCDDYAFCTATAIMSMEATNGNLIDNYIIFCDRDRLTEETRKLLLKISDKILFKSFTEQDVLQNFLNVDKKVVERYSYLAYAKVYIIDYLKSYQNILYLGTDTLAVDDISDILTFTPLAWRRAVKPLHDRVAENEHIDSSVTVPNGDLIFLNEELEKYTSKNLIDIMNNYTITCPPPDEFLFGMFAYKYNINVNILSKSYLCLLINGLLSKAKIIHAHHNKFWQFTIIDLLVPEFKIYYQKWLSLGGKGYNGKTTGPAKFPLEKHKIIPYIYTIDMWPIFYKEIYRDLPLDILPSVEIYNRTLPFYIRGKSEKTRYYVYFKWPNIMHIGFTYRYKREIEKENIRTLAKKILSFAGDDFQILEDERGIFIYKILEKMIGHSPLQLKLKNLQENAQEFLKFINSTIEVIYNATEFK